MLRFAELALFLTPFAVFVVWRLMATEGGPSVGLLLGAMCVVALLAGALFWLSQDQALPPGASYAPARFEGGRVISGRAAPQ